MRWDGDGVGCFPRTGITTSISGSVGGGRGIGLELELGVIGPEISGLIGGPVCGVGTMSSGTIYMVRYVFGCRISGVGAGSIVWSCLLVGCVRQCDG